MWASPAFPAFGLFALAFSGDSSHVPTSQVRRGQPGPFAKRQSPCSGKQLKLGKTLPRFSSQMISLTSFHCSYPPVLQDREITVGPSLKFFSHYRPGPLSINPKPHGFWLVTRLAEVFFSLPYQLLLFRRSLSSRCSSKCSVRNTVLRSVTTEALRALDACPSTYCL